MLRASSAAKRLPPGERRLLGYRGSASIRGRRVTGFIARDLWPATSAQILGRMGRAGGHHSLLIAAAIADWNAAGGTVRASGRAGAGPHRAAARSGPSEIDWSPQLQADGRTAATVERERRSCWTRILETICARPLSGCDWSWREPICAETCATADRRSETAAYDRAAQS